MMKSHPESAIAAYTAGDVHYENLALGFESPFSTPESHRSHPYSHVILPTMLSKLKTLPALAAMASGMALTGALVPAQADDFTGCPTVTLDQLFNSTNNFFCGDKKYSQFASKDFGMGMGSATFAEAGITQTLELSFDPQLDTGSYLFGYMIEVPNPPYIVGYSTTSTGTNPSIASLILDPDGGPSSAYEATASLQVPADTTVSSWTLTVTQTPGPLPILGAGAAFGFSRKLRRRIKVAS